MDGKILVLLKDRSQIDQVMSYLESLARPDTRVVFLLRAARPHLEWIAGYWFFGHTGIESSFGRYASTRQAEIEREESLLNDILAGWKQTFRHKSVQFEIAVYGGSVSQMLESMASTNHVQFLMTPASRIFAFTRVFGFLCPLFGLRGWGVRMPLIVLKHS